MEREERRKKKNDIEQETEPTKNYYFSFWLKTRENAQAHHDCTKELKKRTTKRENGKKNAHETKRKTYLKELGMLVSFLKT